MKSRSFLRAGFAILLLLLLPMTGVTTANGSQGAYISEFLVSASNANYDGIDWNCDGSTGSSSDQFVEIHNPESSAISIQGWSLEVETAGVTESYTFTVNTIEAQSRLVFFRATTMLELSYFDGGIIRLMDASGNQVSDAVWQAEDSVWDTSYARDTKGVAVQKVEPPTPGWSSGEPRPTSGVGAECPPLEGVEHNGSYVLTGSVVTMESQSSVLLSGNVLVVDGIIEAVWGDGEPEPGVAASVDRIHTGGVIYPGLIDAHNHPHYNAIPIWDHGRGAREVDPNGWNNRYEWRTVTDYKNAITKVENGLNDGGSDGCGLMIDSMKHAEVKSIVGGTTAIQGSTSESEDAFDSILARNLEKSNFGQDNIETRVGGSWFPADYSGSHIKNAKASGNLDAWMIHLAEGIDEPSRAEFDALVNNDLVIDELIVIHGTALTSNEFSRMAAVDASLVWSPMSNLLLYGDTADIAAADEAGVSIHISPDWNPSGAKSVLHEVKIADWWDTNVLGDRFTDFEMAQMMTTNAIDQVGWTDYVGRIKAGLAADLLVLDSFHSNPYRNLIEAVDPDVRLVTVGGIAVFGDADLMGQMSDDPEVMLAPGFQKTIDVKFQGIPGGTSSYADISGRLKSCLENLSIGPRPFDPWYTYGDDRYFDVLNRSGTFQHGRNVDLWSTYYNILLDENGNRTNANVIEPPVILPNGPGAGLVRILTAPVGAEVSGLFVDDEGRIFVNAMHPSGQNAIVATLPQAAVFNHGIGMSSLQLPSDASEEAEMRSSLGPVQILMNSGDLLDDGKKAGGIYAMDDESLLFVSQHPDANILVPSKTNDNSGTLYTAWENRPAGLSHASMLWDSEAEAWVVSSTGMVNLSSIGGAWVLCFATLSPWDTPLLSEELYFDNTEEWNDASASWFSDREKLADALGFFPNPYRYGHIIEISGDHGATPSLERLTTLGRFSHENAQVMPDQRTVYLTDDGDATVLFRFVADQAGDLTSGTLYAAHLIADSSGHTVDWIRLAHANTTEIESWIADYDGIDESDYVTGSSSYISDTEISDWAESISGQDLDEDGIIANSPVDNRVAFLESRKAAAALGATDEWTKMEGVTYHPSIGERVFVAVSSIRNSMSDNSEDLRMNENRCGAIMSGTFDSTYTIKRMDIVLEGIPEGNGCADNGIAGPDNIVAFDGGLLAIAEDTSHHKNNMLWIWDAGSTSSDDSETPTLNEEDLPLIFSTFGPFGGEQHPSNTTWSKGIHIEECVTNPESMDDGRVRGCGAIVILMSKSKGCFVEQWSNEHIVNAEIVYSSPCPDDFSWIQPHPEVSETYEWGDWPVSRLDPSYELGSAITFPGRTCEDAIVVEALVIGENQPDRGEDPRIGDWFCRDAANWIVPILEENNSGELMEENVSSITDEIWYWAVVILSFSILTISIVIITRLLRDRVIP